MSNKRLFLIFYCVSLTNYCVSEDTQAKINTISELYTKYITYLIPQTEKNTPQNLLLTEIMKKAPDMAVVSSLIKNNPVHEIDDGQFLSPLMSATIFGHNEIVELLIQAKVNINQINRRQQNAVMMANLAHNQEALQKLIKAGAILDAQDNLGCDATEYAKYTENMRAYNKLLSSTTQATPLP